MNASNPKKKIWQEKVNAHCKACIYDNLGGAGTWREQVEACTSRDCDLYEIRPVSACFDAQVSHE